MRTATDGRKRGLASSTLRWSVSTIHIQTHRRAPPSTDLEHAWPNLSYVIISVNRGEAGDATVWRLRDDRSGFDEGELRWQTQS